MIKLTCSGCKTPLAIAYIGEHGDWVLDVFVVRDRGRRHKGSIVKVPQLKEFRDMIKWMVMYTCRAHGWRCPTCGYYLHRRREGFWVMKGLEVLIMEEGAKEA